MSSTINSNAMFIKVICNSCKQDHIIFSRATTKVKCGYCNAKLTTTKGGKCKLTGCKFQEKMYG